VFCLLKKRLFFFCFSHSFFLVSFLSSKFFFQPKSRLPLLRGGGSSPGRGGRSLQLRHGGHGPSLQRPQGRASLFGSVRRDGRPRAGDCCVHCGPVLLQERHEAPVKEHVGAAGPREQEPGQEGDLDLLESGFFLKVFFEEVEFFFSFLLSPLSSPLLLLFLSSQTPPNRPPPPHLVERQPEQHRVGQRAQRRERRHGHEQRREPAHGRGLLRRKVWVLGRERRSRRRRRRGGGRRRERRRRGQGAEELGALVGRDDPGEGDSRGEREGKGREKRSVLYSRSKASRLLLPFFFWRHSFLSLSLSFFALSLSVASSSSLALSHAHWRGRARMPSMVLFFF